MARRFHLCSDDVKGHCFVATATKFIVVHCGPRICKTRQTG